MPGKPWSENKDEESKISNTEWGMAISILAVVDVIQIGFDLLFQIGVFINRFIDVAVGLAWSTYLYLRGVNLKNIKSVGSILLTFFLEEIPDLDALPLWTLDGVFVFGVTKAEKELKKVAEAGVAVAAVALAPETGGASLAAEGAVEGGLAAAEAGEAAEGVAGVAEGVEGAGSEAAEGAEAGGAETPEAEDGGVNEEAGETQNEGEGEEMEGKPCRTQDGRPGVWTRNPKNPAALVCVARQVGRQNQPGQGGGGATGGRDGGSGPLNSRGGAQANRAPGGGPLPRTGIDNFLDLSLSYGERKKQKEKDDDEKSLSA